MPFVPSPAPSSYALTLAGVPLAVEVHDGRHAERIERTLEASFFAPLTRGRSRDPSRDGSQNGSQNGSQGELRLAVVTPDAFEARVARYAFDGPGEESMGFEIRSQDDALWIARGDTRFVVDLAAEEAFGSIHPSFWECNPHFRWQMFAAVFTALLRTRDRFALHGNACVDPESGCGYLILGLSGAGKTTLSLSLASQDFELLPDDLLFLTRQPHWKLSGARRGFGCGERTLRHFPRFAELEPLYRMEGKRVVDLREVLGERFVEALTPSVVLFPEITDAPHTQIEPLAPLDALVALAEHSIGFLLGGAHSGRHFALLGALLETVRCYRVRSGADVLEDPAAVVTLLRRHGC